MRIAPLLLIVLVACKSKQAEPAAAAAKKTAVTVSIAGKPMTVAQAYIKAQPIEGAYAVYLTSGKSSCEELLGGMYDRGKDDQTVLFSVGKRLAADGALTSEVVDLSRMGSDVTIAPGSKVSVEKAPDKGQRVEVAVDADVEVKDEGKIAIHGRVVAEGCGMQSYDASSLPKAKHPSTATVTLAGTQVPLAGARRNVRTGELELSTAPLACTDSTPLGAVMAEYTRGFWAVRGTWLGNTKLQNTSMRESDGQPETKNLVIETGAARATDDGATIQLTLRGTGTIGGYAVALAGAIEAVDCP
jgi:hypothetical protein